MMRDCQRVHNNDCSKRARDSVTPDSLCVAWLNDGLAGCALEWCQVTVDDNWYAAAAAAVCVWSQRQPRASHDCTKAQWLTIGPCRADSGC